MREAFGIVLLGITILLFVAILMIAFIPIATFYLASLFVKWMLQIAGIVKPKNEGWIDDFVQEEKTKWIRK